MTSSHRLSVAPLLLAALLGSGCGAESDSKPGEPATAKVDACQLFTFEDAQAVAGETLASMSSTLDEAVGRSPLQCIYNSGSLDQPRILSLLIREHRSPDAAKRLQESSRSSLTSMSGGKVQDVPGLGDGAVWVGGRIQQLHVLSGSRQFIITVQSPDGTDQLALARDIATRVLNRQKAANKA
ncbi:MAG: hypothetical protein ACJ75H_12825 [Thermoanaerobaculia bacterium]